MVNRKDIPHGHILISNYTSYTQNMFEIRSHGEFIEIHSSVLTWYSKFTGTGGHAKAGAFYPFIFTAPSFRKLSSERQEALLRHEKIHFAQQKESLHI